MKKSSARLPPAPPRCCEPCTLRDTDPRFPMDVRAPGDVHCCYLQRSCCVNLQRAERTCTCPPEVLQKRKSRVGLLGTLRKKLSSTQSLKHKRDCESSPSSPGHPAGSPSHATRQCCKAIRSRSAERPRSTSHKETGCKSATLRKKLPSRREEKRASRDYENDSTDSEGEELQGAVGGTAKVMSPPTDGYGHATAMIPRKSLSSEEGKEMEGAAQSICPSDIVPSSWSLSRELLRLSKYGWYWGPINRLEAESKLVSQPDGSFLVRDSSDERYLLSLSFRSFGQTLHTRIEHSNSGVFSFYSQPDADGFPSVVELIEHSMTDSQGGVFCYSRARTPNAPSFPVRLTRPVSRFTQVRSLQYQCRFIIRQYTRLDHIQRLPLPKSIRAWLELNQY